MCAWFLGRSEDDIVPPGAGLTECLDKLVLEINHGPLQQTSVLLSAEHISTSYSH